MVGVPPAWECLPTLSSIPSACAGRTDAVKGDFLVATEASDANAKAIIAKTSLVSSLGTTIGADNTTGLKKVTKTAFDLYDAQKTKVDRMQKIVNEVASALLMHREELKVLEKPLIVAKALTVLETRKYVTGMYTRTDLYKALLAGWKSGAIATDPATTDTDRKGLKKMY